MIPQISFWSQKDLSIGALVCVSTIVQWLTKGMKKGRFESIQLTLAL